MAEPKHPDAAEWVPPANDPGKLRAWAGDRKGEVDCIHRTMTIRNSWPSMHDVERMSNKLNALKWADDQAIGVARGTLIDELNGPLYSAWCYYLEEQAKLDRAREEKEERERRERLKERARAKAIAYRNQHARTSGTVVTGLVDLQTGETYVGQSGMANRIVPRLHPVMRELLGGGDSLTGWPKEVCGEINVMNAYLHASKITSVSEIPENSLAFHSETFNSGGDAISRTTGKPVEKTPHWQSRGACDNCKTWILRIKAEFA